MRHLNWHCVVFFCLTLTGALCGSGALAGQSPLHVSWAQPDDLLAPYMAVLEDPGGQLTWRDIQDTAYAERFRPVTAKRLNFGLTSSVVWLRFRVATALEGRGTATIDRVFSPGAGFPGRLIWSLYDGPTGSLIAANHFGTDGYEIVKMTVSPAARHYYLKVHSDTSLILTPRLSTWNACLEQNRIAAMGFGVFFGIIAAVAVYNLLLFFSFNDRSYLWYVIHLVFVLLYFSGINGLTGQYVLTGNPDLVGLLNRSFLGGMAASMVLLSRSFLMTGALAPRIDRVFLILFCLITGLVSLNAVTPARPVNTLLSLLGVVMPPLMMLASWQSLSRGFKPAFLYMIAWGIFVAGTISFALTTAGLIPLTPAGFYAFQAGSAVAAVLLSFALGNRIRSLRSEKAVLKKKEKDLRRLAAIDPLTGAANRRAFMTEGKAALELALDAGQPFSLLMLDVDHFKAVNDTHGHSAGDKVLKSLVSRSAGILRETDIFGRLGGEEFGVVLPDTDADAAAAIGERLRRTLAGNTVTVGTAVISVTVSMGLACPDPRDPGTLESIMAGADAALYRAKQQGRNCLVSAGPGIRPDTGCIEGRGTDTADKAGNS